MTNREKFKETFGFEPNTETGCIAPFSVCNVTKGKCEDCPFDTWWDNEYKACFTLREDL